MTTVSLIVDAAITRLDALEAIAAAVGSPLREAGTSLAWIALPGGGRATVDIPKFGEAPPLAIDVTSSTSDARGAADDLLAALAAADAWPVDWPVARDY
jgi:hypothetical protein